MNLRYRLTRWALSKWVTPRVIDADSAPAPDHPIYVFANPSVTDAAMLDLVAQNSGRPRPVRDGERRYLALNRPTGFWRRLTMRSAPAELETLLTADGAETSQDTLVPVVVFWGRAPSRGWSFWRAFFSETWSVTGRFKRLINIVINRGDIYVSLGTSLPVSEAAGDDLPANRRGRRAARLLRVRLRNQRLAALGPDFSHRRTLVQQIVHARAVQIAIANQAKGDTRLQAKLTSKAQKQARTIASDLSYPTVRVLESLLTRFWNRIYDGVDFNGAERLAELAQNHTLVYVPSHRSHLDYLLLSYLLFHRGLMIPHIAAGDNLNLPVVGSILRRGGAFFMRRSFRDDEIYRAVFSEYLYQVYRRGHSVEFFPEGGRSRTGRLLRARTGLLRMSIGHQLRGLPKPIAFVPVYVGYEKLVEAASYLAELRGENKRGESLGDVFRSFRLIRQDFGRVSVNIGEPLFLDRWVAETKAPASASAAARLGEELMVRINKAADVNATNLVALATLDTPRLAIEADDLAGLIGCYQKLLEALAWPTTERSPQECINHSEALQLVERETASYGEVISLDTNTAVLMTWYRNNVAHTLALPSLIACFITNRRRPISAAGLQSMVDTVFPYLARELSMPETAGDVRTVADVLVRQGLLEATEQDGYAAPPADTTEHHRLRLLAAIVLQNLERLYLAASLITRAPLSRKELLRASQSAAQLLARLYGLNAPEFSDRRLFDQFVDHMLERGAISETADGTLAPGEIVHSVTRLARFIIPPPFQRAVQRVGTRQNEHSAP